MDNRGENGKLELSLKWNNFTDNIVTCLETCFGDQDFVDVTLACEGGSVQAHRLILSASSHYFRKVLKENICPHPVIILKGVSLDELQALLIYMYHGEVKICEKDIPRLLDVARFLEIRGLASPQDKDSIELDQDFSNGTNGNINNNGEVVSSELKSLLLDNNLTSDSLKRQCRRIPKLHSILQTQVSSNTRSHSKNIPYNFNEDDQQEEILLENNVKEEIDDFSNDSMNFEMNNAENSQYDNESCDQPYNYEPKNVPSNNINSKQTSQVNEEKSYEYSKLAFYEPRPCPKCNKMYRDAATLRTHMSIMHVIIPHKISCSCGAQFLTKYDMYNHRKRGHK
uniref:BTB domain-containing protein n=1 Tax=Clastoptera arizonana TaxID=38151 RepID=A0A1B6E5X5_9HEMI